MRRKAIAAASLGGLFLAGGAFVLADPVPPPSDVPGFALASGGVLLLLVAASLRARARARRAGSPGRAWRIPHCLWGAYAGLSAAALFLAYKDSLPDEWHAFGPRLLLDAALRALLAPVGVALGLLVGYVDPEAPLYVAVSLAVALLGTRMLRKRLWPRLAGRPGAASSVADAR